MTKITPRATFDTFLDSGSVVLSLVGMSNVGKSHWSRKLEKHGFHRICCDDMIEAKLDADLREQGYAGGIQEVARWMGQPGDPQFAANEQRYLELEKEAVRTALDVAHIRQSDNIIIDTTGSIVHLGLAVRHSLAEQTLVVYLEATDEMRQSMYEQYLREPKPVAWGEVYRPRDDEPPLEARARLYPSLLAHRAGHYAAIADVTIPCTTTRKFKNAEQFLDHVRRALY